MVYGVSAIVAEEGTVKDGPRTKQGTFLVAVVAKEDIVSTISLLTR